MHKFLFYVFLLFSAILCYFKGKLTLFISTSQNRKSGQKWASLDYILPNVN